ncbi:hypothetical protein ABZ345_18000 [Lentzea sp. NPDC005914]|uniref:hypothetical protein n=1 Tax=Lentzea sp. NPDC005914 TaxID=3154572 RepID=UPI0033D40119
MSALTALAFPTRSFGHGRHRGGGFLRFSVTIFWQPALAGWSNSTRTAVIAVALTGANDASTIARALTQSACVVVTR